jgi:hypothetical protein
VDCASVRLTEWEVFGDTDSWAPRVRPSDVARQQTNSLSNAKNCSRGAYMNARLIHNIVRFEWVALH